MQKGIRALGFLTAASVLLMSAPASAQGCNGVVNQAIWGCALWDNHNGPQYPYYRAPSNSPSATIAPGAKYVPNNGSSTGGRSGSNGMITSDGAGLIGKAR